MTSTLEEEGARALHHLQVVVQAEAPTSIAAILLETVPGTAGIMGLPPGYLAGVRALSTGTDQAHLDEVMAGRTHGRMVCVRRRHVGLP